MPTLCSVPDDCPTEVLEIMHNCFNMDPELRPTAMELVELLKATPAVSARRAPSVPMLSGGTVGSSDPPSDLDAVMDAAIQASATGRQSLDGGSRVVRAVSVGRVAYITSPTADGTPPGAPSSRTTTRAPSIDVAMERAASLQQQQLQQQQLNGGAG